MQVFSLTYWLMIIVFTYPSSMETMLWSRTTATATGEVWRIMWTNAFLSDMIYPDMHRGRNRAAVLLYYWAWKVIIQYLKRRSSLGMVFCVTMEERSSTYEPWRSRPASLPAVISFSKWIGSCRSDSNKHYVSEGSIVSYHARSEYTPSARMKASSWHCSYYERSMLAVAYDAYLPSASTAGLHHLINMALIYVEWIKVQPNLLPTPYIELSAVASPTSSHEIITNLLVSFSRSLATCWSLWTVAVNRLAVA
jgi:hypothetical protein